MQHSVTKASRITFTRDAFFIHGCPESREIFYPETQIFFDIVCFV